MTLIKSTCFVFAVFAIAPQLSLAGSSFSAPAGNLMSYENANEYCKSMRAQISDAHLPSVREMATYAALQGAAGIKETSLPDSPLEDPKVKAETILMAEQGYRMVQKSGLWTPQVDFYYSAVGFQNSQDSVNGNLWTSSTDSSQSSLIGGKISQVWGKEQKFTLSSLNGSLAEDVANSGLNSVICATSAAPEPAPAPANSNTTVVTISPLQIEFSTRGKTLLATISDSSLKPVQTVELDTSDLGRDEKTIEASKEYCADQVAKSVTANKNLRLDLSYQKPEKFCSVSDETVSPGLLSKN